MAYSYVNYTSTGGQNFNVPFPYLEADHVKVLINGVETTAFTWSDAATIHLNAAPAVGATILIKRETPRDGMDKSFSAQPRLKGGDLDEALLQAYYVGLEALDGTQLDWGAVEAKDLALAAQAAAEAAADLAATYTGSAGAGTYMEVPSAPATDANEVKLYAKDVTGVAELFIRKESNGAEIQVTSGSILNGTPGMKNFFINGCMRVAQRDADQTLDSSIRYGRVDRWTAFWNSSTGVTPGTQGVTTSGSFEGYSIAILSGLTCSGTNSIFFGQRIEAANAKELVRASAGIHGGISIQFRVSHNFGVDVNFSILVYTANATDNFSAVTARYSGNAQAVPSGQATIVKVEGIAPG